MLLQPLWAADAPHSHPVTNIYIVRTAEQMQAPHVITYRVVEWTQERGRWIFPDLGYFDTGYGSGQIWFVGAGGTVQNRRRFDWTQEFYLTQEAGPQSCNRRSLWLWPVVNLRFPKRLASQVVLYPTIPLNHAQHRSLDFDRAKLEWSASSQWLVGAGYAGGLAGSDTWQSNPFLTTTRKTRAGDFEFWLQRTNGGGQVQFRYVLMRGDK